MRIEEEYCWVVSALWSISKWLPFRTGSALCKGRLNTHLARLDASFSWSTN